MVEIIKKIVTNVLIALYEPLGFALALTFFFMCSYIFAEKYGWKKMICSWGDKFKTSVKFRRMCVLVFYTSLLLFRTLLNRSIWDNPLTNVIGTWGLYNVNGHLTTETFENMALFVPYMVLLMWCKHDKIFGQQFSLVKTIWKAIQIVFLFSLGIELLQLILRLGTFQLSDLFYNTLGGFVGGLLYWCAYKITHKKKSKDKE